MQEYWVNVYEYSQTIYLDSLYHFTKNPKWIDRHLAILPLYRIHVKMKEKKIVKPKLLKWTGMDI